MGPEHQEIVQNVKLAAIAAVSAVLTATLVIGAGRTLLPKPAEASVPADAIAVMQVADRQP
ncbi:hypothetical protein [Brevundimonas kwangchunensis]|uniref:hypothetical protein n=1 Tax=Brevundimonas kwangchunensis TaxID=322163 RepID=UPI0031DA1E16